VAVVAEDPQKQLEWEARQRPRAGIAAVIFVLSTIGGLIALSAFEDVPNPSGIETLQRAVQPGPVGQLQSLQIPAFEYVVDHQVAILAISFLGLLAPIAGGWAMGFLAVATRARRPELRRWVVYLPIVGGVLTGLAFFLLRGVDAVTNAHRILDGPRTVADATKVTWLFIFANAIGFFGQLASGGGYVLVSLNAMRAGLLTRVLGILGIATGVFTVLAGQLGSLLQIMIQAILALLFFRVWMGGIPPAWQTGRAEPWPSRQPPQPRRQAPEPATEPAGPASTAAARRSKRKKRH
jgi:hypothetical protein